MMWNILVIVIRFVCVWLDDGIVVCLEVEKWCDVVVCQVIVCKVLVGLMLVIYLVFYFVWFVLLFEVCGDCVVVVLQEDGIFVFIVELFVVLKQVLYVLWLVLGFVVFDWFDVVLQIVRWCVEVEMD